MVITQVSTLAAALLLCTAFSNAGAIQRVAIPSDVAWANIAWGGDDGGKDTTTNMKIIDLDFETAKSIVDGFKALGHIIVCYFSVGTAEPFRADYIANTAAWQALSVSKMSGWDEWWLDISNLEGLKALMTPRFQTMKNLGCDAIEPDNTDCYDNSLCYSNLGDVSKRTRSAAKALQQAYNQWQCDLAHSMGMSIGLKNSLDLVPIMATSYDFTVNEECQSYSECGDLQTYFSSVGKAVLNTEYTSSASKCTGGATYNMMTKYCNGGGSGSCGTNEWINCFSGSSPMPATTYVDDGAGGGGGTGGGDDTGGGEDDGATADDDGSGLALQMQLSSLALVAVSVIGEFFLRG